MHDLEYPFNPLYQKSFYTAEFSSRSKFFDTFFYRFDFYPWVHKELFNKAVFLRKLFQVQDYTLKEL